MQDSAGGFFGALFMFVSLEQLGRRWTVIISDAVFAVGAVLCTVATNQLGLVYAGRLLTGLGVGGIAAVCPIYIAEISPPAIRGRLTGFFESSYQIGAVIGFWINYGIVHNIEPSSSTSWRIPMGVQLIPAGLLALGIPFLRESPTWLLKHGREEQAYNVLSYYRAIPADHVYIAQDVAHIQNQIEGERAVTGGARPTFGAFVKSALRESCMKGMRNRFLLVFIMFMWQGWSGAAAINYYSTSNLTVCVLTANIITDRHARSNDFLQHRPHRRDPVDGDLRHHQSRRLSHLLHLLHRHLRPQNALDRLLPHLRCLPVLSRGLRGDGKAYGRRHTEREHHRRRQSGHSSDHDLRRGLVFWRQRPALDHLRRDLPR